MKTSQNQFSDRILELIASGKVKVMTWEQYQNWKHNKTVSRKSL